MAMLDGKTPIYCGLVFIGGFYCSNRGVFSESCLLRLADDGCPSPASRSLKDVGEEGWPRQKQPKKRSLRAVNEHFEAVFNDGQATQVVFQHQLGLILAQSA